MALRMNLWGVDLEAAELAFGSKNAELLSAACDRLPELLPDDQAQSQARAWLKTLIESGAPDRRTPQAEEDGGLLVFRAESEAHVFALHALVHAASDGKTLNLAAESSDYHHGAFPNLISDMRACRFSTSEGCSREFLQCYSDLYRGTPWFGHRFESAWSFYSTIRNASLDHLLDGFAAAKSYKRQLGNLAPEEVRPTTQTGISAEGIRFIDDLEGWFRQVRDAKLDAYVIWW